MRIYFLCFLLFSFSLSFFSQENKKNKWREKVELSGFIKYMNTTSVVDLDSLITDNLIHNRIRFKAYLNDKITTVIEMRNRIFYGEATRLNPSLGKLLEKDNGQIDLSFVSLERKPLIIHSILDRAYIRYSEDNWELTVGRQRINWGVNLAFNPNDLFNAYSLVDFDYQERPGVDAIRFQYYEDDMSSFEGAVQIGNSLESSVIAGLWKFNKWKYDFQFLAANYFKDIAIGTAWAGNIKNAGFKTELSYFQPKTKFFESNGALSLSTTLDYSFKKGTYINTSILYNSLGASQPLNTSNLFQTFIGDISAKSLMPSKWTYFGQVSGAFNPALNGSFAVFYMQGINLALFMPSIVYNINDDWELMFTVQSAFGELNTKFQSMGSGIYLRTMYSF
tara:strand:- start:168 stop:1343 length:1176 start_codon:yes stop_codon:yes gene_type:complete